MVRVLLFFFKRRLLGLFLLVLLVVAAFTQVGDISVQLSLTRFMRGHADSHNQKTRSSNATSSSVDNDYAVGTKEYVPVIFHIYAKHNDILSTDYLSSMQALTTKIMKIFPGVKITSILTSNILTLNKIVVDDDPLLMLDTIVNETSPLSDYELLEKKVDFAAALVTRGTG